jgi:hypothetical protein
MPDYLVVLAFRSGFKIRVTQTLDYGSFSYKIVSNIAKLIVVI